MCLGTGGRSDQEAAVVKLRNVGAVGKVGNEFRRFSSLAAIKVGATKNNRGILPILISGGKNPFSLNVLFGNKSKTLGCVI